GAIYQFSSAKLTITNSTLSGNTARFGEGGAIYLFSSYVAGSVIRNCTISGNTSGVGGGGLGWRSASGTFPIQNSTITANTAGANKYVTTGGGGVAVISGAAGNFSLESSIVAGNITLNAGARNGPGPDIFRYNAGTWTVNKSLIGVSDSGNITLSGS